MPQISRFLGIVIYMYFNYTPTPVAGKNKTAVHADGHKNHV